MINAKEDGLLNTLLPEALALARLAGEAILKIYSEINPQVSYKADNSPLTRADLVSHNILVEGLTHLTPEWPVLSEESKEIPFEKRRAWRYFWLVDPLDGTKEFLRSNSEFTVNIALVLDGAPILGVVYAPAIGKLYYAARNAGAWKADGKTVRPIRVAGTPNGTIRVVMTRSHGSAEDILDRFIGVGKLCEFVSMGSSLKFCLIAEGSADIYPRTGPTMEWDTAAAQCVVEQAGGSVTNLNGDPMIYNKPVLLNPSFIARGGC